MAPKGRDKILRNLNKAIQGIEGRTQAGLTAAALLVKARALPQTPINTGNLRASAFVAAGTGKKGVIDSISRKISNQLKGQMETENHKYTGGASLKIQALTDKDQPWAVIGYTASYAIFVHEIDRGYRVGNWKFLHNAVEESRGDILKIIKGTAKI